MKRFGGRQVFVVAALLCVVASACSVKKEGSPKASSASASTTTGGEQPRDAASGFSAPGGVKPGTQATKDGVVPPSSVAGNGGPASDRGVGANDVTLGAII